MFFERISEVQLIILKGLRSKDIPNHTKQSQIGQTYKPAFAIEMHEKQGRFEVGAKAPHILFSTPT